MVGIEELSQLTTEELKEVQSIIRLFGIMGISKEQLAVLPEVLANWETVKKNMNGMATDLAAIKSDLSATLSGKKGGKDQKDASEIIRESLGFDSNIERVIFPNGGDR